MSTARAVRKDAEPCWSRLCVFGPCRFLFGGRQRAGSGGDNLECSVLSDPAPPPQAAEPRRLEEHLPSDVVKGALKRRDSDESSLSSASTRAPGSPQQVGSLESADFFHLDDIPEQITVPLSAGLLFYGPKSTVDVDEERPLLQAQSLDFSTSGEIHALGRLRSDEVDAVQQTPAERAEVKEIMLDVRQQRQDEPRLVHLIGALVHKGRIDRIFLADASCGSICCRVCRPGSRDGEHSISLEQAIKEMFEVERCRQNASLESYQRQICSSMMRKQRSRYLGLDQ